MVLTTHCSPCDAPIVALVVLSSGCRHGFFMAIDLPSSRQTFRRFRGRLDPLTFGALVFIIRTWHSVLRFASAGSARALQPDRFFAAFAATTSQEFQYCSVSHPTWQGHTAGHRQLREASPIVAKDRIALTSVSRTFPALIKRRVDSRTVGAMAFWHITVHFGFVEIPDLPAVLHFAKKDGVPVLDQACYFIERDDLISRKHRKLLSRWRVALFFISCPAIRACHRRFKNHRAH